MRTKHLVKATHQISLPIHLCPTSITLDPRMRSAVIAVLARLLLEAAAASDRSEEVRDES